MGITKILDSSSAYSPIDTYWWTHNEVNFNGWDRKQVVVKEKKWLKFVEDNFNNLQSDFHFVNKKKPFEMENYRGTSNKLGLETKVMISWNPTIRTKGEITVNMHLYWHPENNEQAKSLITEIAKMMIYSVDKSSVYMVIQDESGLDLRSFDINIPELDIELNYGSEWAEKHDYLLKALSRENKKGIALLHGLPGTGKSMYIRYLISLLSENRTMIY